MAGPQQVVRPSSVPTDKVLDMRQQGLSNNQVIQILQRDGYDLPAIFNALNQADIKGGIEAVPAQALPHDDAYPEQEQGGYPMAQESTQQQVPMQQTQQPTQFMQQPMQNQQEFGNQIPMLQDTGMMQDYGNMGAPEGMPQEPQGMPMQPMQPMQGPMDYSQQQGFGPAGVGGQNYGSSFETQRIEELAEAIIDEKWNEIVRSINKIIDWKERVESRVTKMEQQLEDMNKNFDLLHKGVLGKISEYDRNLTNVGAEIKAMDKVFQKVLPSLTENVSELSRITSGMRKK